MECITRWIRHRLRYLQSILISTDSSYYPEWLETLVRKLIQSSSSIDPSMRAFLEFTSIRVKTTYRRNQQIARERMYESKIPKYQTRLYIGCTDQRTQPDQTCRRKLFGCRRGLVRFVKTFRCMNNQLGIPKIPERNQQCHVEDSFPVGCHSDNILD